MPSHNSDDEDFLASIRQHVNTHSRPPSSHSEHDERVGEQPIPSPRPVANPQVTPNPIRETKTRSDKSFHPQPDILEHPQDANSTTKGPNPYHEAKLDVLYGTSDSIPAMPPVMASENGPATRPSVYVNHPCNSTLIYMIVLLFAFCLTLLVLKHTVNEMTSNVFGAFNTTVIGGFSLLGAGMTSIGGLFTFGPVEGGQPGGEPGTDSLVTEISPLIPQIMPFLAALEKGTYDIRQVRDLIPHDELFEHGIPLSDNSASTIEMVNAWYDKTMCSYLHSERQAMRQFLVSLKVRPATRFFWSDRGTDHASSGDDSRETLSWHALLVALFTDQPRQEIMSRFDEAIYVLAFAGKARNRVLNSLKGGSELMTAMKNLYKDAYRSADSLGQSLADLVEILQRCDKDKAWGSIFRKQEDSSKSESSATTLTLLHSLEVTHPSMNVLFHYIIQVYKSISNVRSLLEEDMAFIDKALEGLRDQRGKLVRLKARQINREYVREIEHSLKNVAEQWLKRTLKYVVKEE